MYYDGWHIGEAEHFDFDKDPVDPAWSLHRLIEMLPEKIIDKHERDAILQMTCYNGVWRVKYTGAYDLGLILGQDLIDALYDMVVELKAEGVI